MACSIVYDNQGNKIGVSENNQLFQEILNNPQIKNFDEALSVFLETYSGEFDFNNGKTTTYLNRITKVKTENPSEYWSVNIPSADVVKTAEENNKIVEVDGGMAIVTEDNSIVGVFKDSNNKGVAQNILEKAISLGATKLDNYDGYLTKIYEKNGFKVVSRLAFNEQLAPKDWSKQLQGTPDVVFMVYAPNNSLDIEEKSFNKDQYDEAQAYRDSFVRLPQNNTGKTQAFFSDVVEGKSSKYKAKKEWTPLLTFSSVQEKFKTLYDKFKGNFDNHIATSIPTFRETQIKVGSTLVEMFYKKPQVVNTDLEALKNNYIEKEGITPSEPTYTTLDNKTFSEIAEYHSEVKDDRQNPEMKKSYRAFLDETKKQYEYLVSEGYTIEPWMGEGEPYGVNSDLVRKDVLENKHLFYLRSRSATGEGDEQESSENYMPFESTGIILNGDDVLFNDLFRAVHDIFGHAMVKNTFSAQGELNAYKTHSNMYSKEAQKALFLETVVYNAYYRENQKYAPRKIYDIPQTFLDKINEKPLLYDIGGSEGGFAKAITEESNGTIESINLDVNDSMEKAHNQNPVAGSTFVKEAFYESYTDEDTGVTYKKHVPSQKADVVHESMVFQFISPERGQFVKEVKDNYLKEDGILLLEEKLVPETQEEWLINEEIKDEYKRQFYSQEEITGKQEEILTGMLKNQTKVSDLLNELNKNFEYIGQYWNAGNFKGFIATNSKGKYDEFFNKLGGVISFEGESQNTTANTESPTLKYQTQDGQVFSDYGEALRNTQGEDLDAGINSVSGFKPLFTISTNTNINTTEGMINNLIKSDLLSGEKYLENGVNYYKPQGKSEVKQVANVQVVKDLLQQKFGVKAVKVSKDGFISIIEENKRENISLAGRTIKIADLHKMDFKELKDNFGEDTAINILANKEFLNASKQTTVSKQEFIPENELQEKLMNLLKKFGIKTLAFEEYIKNYEIRNKLPINARALADLANKVVAFKDGNIEEADLLEETAHLIEASIPQEQKENILRNIHKTREWGQFSEQYKQIYATEEEVRKEILGKVIANSFKEQFQARNTNQTEDSIINKIKELVKEFFDRISAYFQDSFQKELDTLNKALYTNLMQETLQLDLGNAKGVFFNATEASPKIDTLLNKLSKMVEGLRQTTRELSKSATNSADRASLNIAEEALERGESVRAIATLTQLIDSQVNQINRSLENTKEGELPISAEENVVAQALKETMIPSLAEVSAKLNERDATEKALANEVREVISKANTVFGRVTTARKATFNVMVESMIEKYNMTDKEKAEYQNMINLALSGVQADTDFLHAHIGSLLLAKNPLLNMAGLITERMNLQKLSYAQPLVKKLVDAFGKFSNSDLLKLIDNKTGDLIQERDIELENKLKTAEKVKIANEVLAKAGLKERTDENTDFKEFFNSLEDSNLGLVFNAKYRQWEEDNINVFYFTEQYRKAMKSHTISNFFQEGGALINEEISANAIETDRALRGQSTQIRMNAKNGVLTKSDKAELKKVEKLRAELSNPRDSEGNLLKGIKEHYNENLQKWVVEIDYTDKGFYSLSQEQRTKVEEIVGLNHLTYLKQDFFKNKEAQDLERFIAEVEALPVEEQWQFIEENATVSYPREYFDSFKENPNLVQKLTALGTQEALEKVRQIRAKESLRNKVMREISVYNKPGETNFVEMHSTQKETIKLAQTELENLYSQAKKLLPKDEAERTELNIDSRVNDAYLNHLEDSGEDELTFIMNNVTSTGLSAIEGMRAILTGSKSPNKTFDKYFTDDLINERGELTPQARQALIEYGKTRLLPYLRKTEPLGYTQAKNTLSASEFIRRTDLVSISPNISYSERINEDVNQEYLDNRDQGKPQIKKSWIEKVRSKQYDDLFSNGANKELKEGYETLKTLMKEAVDMQGLTGRRDIYMRPQVRATEIERFTRLSPTAISQNIQEFFQFRPEEKELGEQISQGIYTIPNYYNQRLEDPKEVSNNFLYSYSMYFVKSAENKARRENIGDMFVIDDVLTDTKFESKRADATQTYKMFQNFKYFNFYGVQESFSYEVPIMGRTVDVGKVMKVLNNFGKRINVTGLTTSLTSLGQSTIAKNMERFIGQYITPTASNEGNRLYKQHASDAVKESMGFQSKSFLNVTLEALGLYSLTHRLEDSQYNKAGRTLYNLGGKLHEIANFPVVPRAVLGIICDYRYVDGKIIDEKTFKKLNKPGNWTDYKMLKDDWALAIKDGVLDFNNEAFVNAVKDKITLREGQSLEQYMQDIRLNISTRALAFVQQVDSQIPQHQKAVAQRDQRMNFFLSHQNWLISAVQRKIKNRHFSYAEGEFQEGSWRTVWELIRDSKGNPKKMQELYRNMDDFQKKNIVRGGMELAFANAMALVAMILANYVDDEDDVPYLLAVADVFATRIANEQIGGTAGLPKSIYQAMSPSIMLKQKMEGWAKVNQLFDEEKRGKYLGGFIPFMKDVQRFADPQEYQNSYYHFQVDDGKTFYQSAWMTNFLEK